MMRKPSVAFFIWILVILTGFSATAQTGPQLNYHGRIVDGITNLGVSGMRNFRIQVRTPAGLADNCLMYEETQTKNLVNGVFVINLNNGSGVRADATAPVYTVQQIFSNKNSFGSFTFAGSRCVSTNPFTYTPGPTDSRRVNIWFEDPVGAPGVWEPLPTQTVAYVPSAIESLNVGGFPIEALLRVVDGSGNPSTLPSPMSEAQYTNLMSLTSGSVVTSINGLAGAPVAITGTSGSDFNITTSGSNINFNIPSSSAANRGLLTAADWSTFNAKMPNTGAAVSAALGYTPLAPANNLSDLSNAATARSNLGLGTSATMSVPGAAAAPATATEVVRGDDPRLTGAIVSGSAASGDLSGTYPNPSVAKVGGRTAAQINQSVTDTLAATELPTVSTIVKRDASGNASFVTAQATNFSGNNFFVFNSGNANSIQIAAPTPLPSGDYILTLPDTAGTAGYVLATDGAGNTSWVDPSATSVTSVSANPPLSSSGGFTPTLSISQANTTTDGYVSSTDWNTFNNKLGTTLATGQVWVGSAGSVATPQFLNISNIRSTVAGGWFNAGACASGEILSYSPITDQVTCTAMTLTGSQVATALNGIMTGDATITTGGVLTIANNAVTNAKISSVDWSKVANTPTTYGGYGITDITLANAGNVNTVEAGLDAARGAFGTLGRVYFSTDSREIWYDTGATWLRVGSNAGLGGTVTSVAVNAPLSLSGVATVNPTISLAQATAAVDGYLTSSDFTNFAGKVNRSGDTMTGALNMGGQNITNTGLINMAANGNIQVSNRAADPVGLVAADAGRTWFNTTTNELKYWNGSSVQTIGNLAGVVTGVNGLTGSVNLVLGSAGTDAAIVTASPNVTLNLPTSSAANRGLVSSTDWSNFNSKQAGSAELTGVAGLATTGFVKRTGAGAYTTSTSVVLSTDVSGVLPIANGGTNATTANAALNNLLPTQTANANKFLKTDGTNTSWADISSVAVTSVTAAATANNPIVIAGTATAPTIDIPKSTAVVNGYLSSADWTTFNSKQSSSLATGQVWVGSAGAVATPQFLNISNIKSTVAGNWFNAGACAAGEILTYSPVSDQVTCTAMTLTGSQVATALSGIMSGDATISAAGTLTIGNDKITAAMIAPNSVAWSTDITGKPTTIAGYGITDAVLINAGGVATMEANVDASRGAAGTLGRLYVSRDTGEIWYDNGATWVRVGSNAGLGGTVTNVTGTAPISVATGTSTPVVSMTKSTIAVDGYLAATDFVMFNSKMSSDFSNATGTLPVANGGTGAATASGARTNLGLGTADSPTFTGLTVSGVNGNTLVRANGSGVLANATSADVTSLLGYTPTSSALANNKIFVGNASNIATAVDMSGDASIVASGTITLKSVGTAGTYGSASTVPSITTDAQGRVTNVTTNAYQDATGVTKGVVSVGTNLQVAAGVISLQNATGAQTGALTSADWTTFNNKQGALGFTPLNPANNLSDVASADVSRTNLGLGIANSPTFTGLTLSSLANGFVKSTAGVLSGGNTIALSTDVSGVLPVANGGTGLSAAGANGNVMYVAGGTFATATPDTAGLVDKTSAQSISGVKTFTANPIIDNAGVVQFREATAGGTNYIGLKAPAAVAADVTFTLPAADGTVGQVLKTDGAGNLGWVSAATGTVTSVTSANADIGVATTTTTPVLTLNSGLGANQIAKVGAGAISNNTVIVANGAGGLAGQALTDGQLLIGSTGAAPVAAGITGTANRVTVTNGAGTITLSGPQDIHSGASPTFTGLTLSAITGNTLLKANGSGVLANATSADVTGLLGFTPGAVSVVSGTAPISVATGTSTPVVSITRATAGVDGYLAATDFVTFNSKMSSDFSNVSGTLGIANGGTGGTTAAAARTNLGVGTGDSPSFTGLTVSGVTGNTLLRASGAGVVANATSADITGLLGFTPATSTLANNMIFVGNASNVATAVNMSGDASIVANGTITLKSVGTAGTYGSASTVPSITTDAQGRITNVTTNAYQDATGVTKGVVSVGNNLQVAAGVISVATADGSTTGVITSGDWTRFDSKLSATIAAPAVSQYIRYNGTNWVNSLMVSSDVTTSLGYTPMSPANNLSDLANATTSRTNLGLGTGSSPTFTGLTLSGLTNGFVKSTAGVLSGGNTIALSTDVSGVLPVANGGTGATTIGAGNLVVGNGTGAVTSLAAGSSGNVVYATGASTWSSGTPDTAGLVDKSSVQAISGAKSFGANLTMSSPTALFRLQDNTTNTISMRAPAAVTSYTLTWPAAVGTAGQVLTTDATGVLSWSSAASGTVTSVTSANADIGVATTTTTPVLTLNSGLGANQIAKVGAGAISNNTVIVANGAGGLAGQALTDGQLLIGSTGAAPVAAGITGTANRVTVTNGAGTITLSGPQDIHSGASPTFTGLTLSGVNGNTLVKSNGSGVLANATSADVTGLLGFTPGAVSVVSGTAPISVATGSSTPVVSIAKATVAVDGYLAATDFVTFNSKMSSDFSNATGTLAIANGGTGATTAGAARTNLGVGTGDSPSFTGLTVSGVTGNTLLRASGAGVVANATSADITGLLGFTPATNVLATNMIFVGNGSNVATAVNMSGDASIVANGTITLKNTGTAGTYGSASAVPSITTDAQGRITNVTTNAYQDATGASKGIVQAGANISVAAGVISVATADGSTTGVITSGDWTRFDSKLSATIAAPSTGQYIRYNGANWVNALMVSSDVTTSLGYTPMNPANNLSDVTSAATSRTNLGLGTGNSPTFTGLTLSGVTGNTLVRANGSGVLANATSADITGLLGFTPGVGTVTNVTGTAPISVATGTSTPVVSIAKSTVAVDGYLAATDFVTFNSKMSSDFSNATGTLPVANGGTGASTTSSARTNLGVGTGDSPSFTGLTLSGVNGNTLVKSSGAGVLSNATSADVTGLLGYTPGSVTSITAGTGLTGGTITGTGTIGLGTELAGLNGLATTGFIQRTAAGAYSTVSSIDLTTTVTGTLPVANGGTGAATASGARTNLGLGTADSPAFTGLTLSGVNGNTLVKSNGTGVLSNATSADVTTLLGFTPGSVTSVTSANADIGVATTTTTPVLTLNSGLGANQIAKVGAGAIANNTVIVANGAGGLAGLALTNGQLLIGSTGAAPVAAGITGTANRVTVTNGAGTITLSGPQDIHSGASPTFTGLTLSGVTGNTLVRASGAGVVANATSADITGLLGYTPGVGTVTNVTGTAPVSVATGTSTPVISMAKSTAAVDGYLAAADFTIFAAKMSSDFSNVTGTLGIANGGTGGTTAATARTNLGVGTGDSPTFTGLTLSGVNGNTLVKSNGTGVLSNATSADVTGLLGYTPGSVTSITAGTGLTGGTITGTGTIGLDTELAGLNGLATTGFVKRTGAGAYSTQTSIVLSTDVSGALPIANGGTGATTANGALTNLLPAQAASSVLQSNGTTTSWLTFNTASSNNTLVQRDGSGVLAGYGVSVSGATSGAVTFTAPGTVTSYSLQLPSAQGAAGTVLQNNGAGVLSWASASASADLTTATGTLVVGKGGTGITSGTSGGIPYFNSTSTMASSGLLTANGVMLGGGAGASPTTTAAGTANQVLRIPGGGGAPVFGSIDLSSTAAVTNSLGVANGGTGAATLTAGSLVVGNGTSAVNFLTAGSTGYVVYATGASTWASGSPSTAGLVAQGGNSYTAAMTIGTNDANQLNLETSGSIRMSFDTSGAVRVNGQAYSNATTATTNAGGTVSWDANSSNVMRWTPGTDGASATTVQISNIKPGGSYQLSVKGTASGTGQVNISCSTTNSGWVAATYMPANGPRVVTGTLFKTIYTILYDGQDCLVTWISGF